jgi:hypothetical protein
MRSPRLLFSMLLFFGLAALILHACAAGGDPVVPDTYVPPTLQVMVTINEDQDASNGQLGSSMVSLQFMTNEINPSEFVTFGSQEYVVCNGIRLNLSSFGSGVTNFSVNMTIPSNPANYTCAYYYPQNGNTAHTPIFTVPVLNQLHPQLQRPVSSSADISVSYNYDHNRPDCQVQVLANAPNGNATGNSVPEDQGIYPGPNGGTLNVGSLSGEGNLAMTRTCVPPNEQFDHHNKADDGCQCNGSPLNFEFDKLNVTFKSTATVEVSWVPSNTPATSAS